MMTKDRRGNKKVSSPPSPMCVRVIVSVCVWTVFPKK